MDGDEGEQRVLFLNTPSWLRRIRSNHDSSMREGHHQFHKSYTSYPLQSASTSKTSRHCGLWSLAIGKTKAASTRERVKTRGIVLEPTEDQASPHAEL